MEQRPDQGREEKPRERGDGLRNERQELGAIDDEKDNEDEAEWQFGGETMQQMVATSFNAEGRRLSTRRSCPSVGERRRGARLSAKWIVEGNGGNQFGGGVSVRFW